MALASCQIKWSNSCSSLSLWSCNPRFFGGWYDLMHCYFYWCIDSYCLGHYEEKEFHSGFACLVGLSPIVLRFDLISFCWTSWIGWTLDRIMGWSSSSTPSLCFLCRSTVEPQAHLLLECDFWAQVRKRVLTVCLVDRVPGNWNVQIKKWMI